MGPSSAISRRTVGVKAVGEKIALLPDERRTAVPRPPIFTRPKRRKGVEKVFMSGVTERVTRTFSGSEGMSLWAEEAIVAVVLCFVVGWIGVVGIGGVVWLLEAGWEVWGI